MADYCLFKLCYNCSDNERLQTTQSEGGRVHNIIEASKTLGDDLHVELQTKLNGDPTYQAKYHKSCVTKYLTKAKRSSEKRTASSPSPLPGKRTRSSMGTPFDWLSECFYCGRSCNIKQDPKNPSRWIPAYLLRETEGGDQKTDAIEKRIRDKCCQRANEWS